MTRLVFPDDRMVLRPGTAGDNVRNTAGSRAVVYADQAGTQLADIQTLGGTSVAGSALIIDAYSLLPLFLGPDNIDTVYIQVDNGPLTASYPRVDDRLDTLDSRLDTVDAPWTSYTPLWTASTAPGLGNGTIQGRCARIAGTGIARGRLVFGSTTTYGSGSYQISLPPTIPATGANGKAVGQLFLFQSGQPTRGGTCAVLDNTGTLWLVSPTGGDINPTTPWTWAAGGEIHWTITYEAA